LNGDFCRYRNGGAGVLGQRHPQMELIAADDGSTAGSTEILQRLAAENSERITLIYQNDSGLLPCAMQRSPTPTATTSPFSTPTTPGSRMTGCRRRG
jgi:hypothetical protein